MADLSMTAKLSVEISANLVVTLALELGAVEGFDDAVVVVRSGSGDVARVAAVAVVGQMTCKQDGRVLSTHLSRTIGGIQL
jgi:hypothetical protein